jgi:hypothetical protein
MISLHPCRVVRALLVACSCLALSPAAIHLRADPADWSFTPVIKLGQEGITSIEGAAVSLNGSVAVIATQDNVSGVHLVVGGAVTTIAQVNQALSATLGTVSGFPSVGSTGRPRLAIDGAGRVIFLATVTGGTLPASTALRAFRWDKGAITHLLPDNGFVHLLDTMTDDGRWIAERLTGSSLPMFKEYVVTDGVTTFASYNFTNSRSGCSVYSMEPGHVISPTSMLLVDGTLVQRTLSGGQCDRFNSNEEWAVRIEGPDGRTAATGIRTTVDSTTTSTGQSGAVRPHNFVASANGGVAFRQQNLDPTPRVNKGSYELFIADGAGLRSVAKTDREGEARVLARVLHLDPFGHVSFSTARTAGGTEFFSGPDLDNDRVIGVGDRLFGEEASSITPVQVVGGGNAFRDSRLFLFFYRLRDTADTFGVAVAQKDVTRWANSAGGDWGEAANWSPAAVPGSTSETLFNLEASYDVTVGTRTAGRALIENGSVGFQSTALTLTGPLHVGGSASLTMPGGTLAAGELIVGHLPPLDLVNEPTARFNASGSSFELTVTGPMIVGEAGRGELFITEGSVSAAELRISALAQGAVALGLPGTFFKSLGSVAVGDRAPGTLDVERGAVMSVEADFVVGRGSNEVAPVPGVSRATFRDPPQKGEDVGSLAANRIIVGGFLPGRLEVLDGAIVDAFGFDASGLALITGTASNPAVFSGSSILVSGQAGPGMSSALTSFGDVELGAADGAGTDVVVENGGEFTAFGAVAVGSAAGSRVSVTVTGRGPSGAPSSLEWLGDEVIAGERENRSVDVGYRGVGTVDVLEGASMKVLIMNIGRHPGSRGRVTVGSADDGSPSTLRVPDFPESDPTGFLRVGGATTSGTGDDAVGILELDGGEVFVDTLIAIYPKGVLRGRGRVSAPIMLIDGTVEPSVVLAEVAARAPGGSGTFSAMSRISPASVDGQPTLTLVGNVVFQATAVVKLDIPGSELADCIVVDGPLTLGGTLELNFANGYAPQAGDTLDLITSTLTTGSFATTTINGLAPGFQFTLAPNGAGGVRLTAINDGVAATVGGGRLSVLYSPGELWLTWANTNALEEATNVTGPWRTITNAVSPHVVSTTNDTQQFFRLRSPAP